MQISRKICSKGAWLCMHKFVAARSLISISKRLPEYGMDIKVISLFLWLAHQKVVHDVKHKWIFLKLEKFCTHMLTNIVVNSRLWNDLSCVERDVKLYSLTHSLVVNSLQSKCCRNYSSETKFSTMAISKQVSPNVKLVDIANSIAAKTGTANWN